MGSLEAGTGPSAAQALLQRPNREENMQAGESRKADDAASLDTLYATR